MRKRFEIADKTLKRFDEVKKEIPSLDLNCIINQLLVMHVEKLETALKKKK